MNLFLEHPVFQALGWTLVHSLWQGAVLGMLTWIGLRLLRRRSAQARYLLACAALGVMTAAAAGTYLCFLSGSGSPVANLGSGVLETSVVLTPQAIPAATRSWQELLQPLLPWATLLWGLGATFMSLRLAMGWVFLQRLRLTAVRAPASWQRTVDRLAGRLGLARAVQLLETLSVDGPMVVGWIRPVILVPAAALTGMAPEALEAVLAHELAHIRRLDYLVNLFQSLVEALLFYHPAVWWISRQIRIEREHCCDDAAVLLCGDPVLFARALADLEELRLTATPNPELALAATGGTLMNRIRRIIHPKLPPSPAARAGLFAALAVTALGAATGWGLHREEPPKAANPEAVQQEEDINPAAPHHERAVAFKIRMKGDVQIQPDAERQITLGEGASLQIEDRQEGHERQFSLSRKEGKETRTYTLDGKEAPLDAQWLQRSLTRVKESQAKAARHGALSLEHEKLAEGQEKIVREQEIRLRTADRHMKARERDLEAKAKVLEQKSRELAKRQEAQQGKPSDAGIRKLEEEVSKAAKAIAEEASRLAQDQLRRMPPLPELSEIHVPDIDIDVEHEGDGRHIVVERRFVGPEGEREVILEKQALPTQKEIEALQKTIARLQERLDHLQKGLPVPPAPKPPKPPMAVPAPPMAAPMPPAPPEAPAPPPAPEPVK